MIWNTPIESRETNTGSWDNVLDLNHQILD